MKMKLLKVVHCLVWRLWTYSVV